MSDAPLVKAPSAALATTTSTSLAPSSNEPMAAVEVSRIRRLITALSCASFDRFDRDEALIFPNESDEMGLLEGALQLFMDELSVAKAAAEHALQESERARVELEERLRIIDEQRATILELSSPVIDVWDEVLSLPIVGTLDSQRASEMGDRLLACVVERKASFVLLDLTGVAIVDTATANHIVKLAQGVALLGAECILTGITPRVAQTLAAIGVEWTTTKTMRSLRDGLRYCITERRRGMREEGDAHVSASARR